MSSSLSPLGVLRHSFRSFEVPRLAEAALARQAVYTCYENENLFAE